jgi:hypothetical protein
MDSIHLPLFLLIFNDNHAQTPSYTQISHLEKTRPDGVLEDQVSNSNVQNAKNLVIVLNFSQRPTRF